MTGPSNITQLYVDAVDGDDSNSGTSPQDAKATLAAVGPLVVPETIVTVAPGLYQEPFRPVGTASGNVTYRAVDEFQKPIIRPTGQREEERPLLCVEPNIDLENLTFDGINTRWEAAKFVFGFETYAKNISCLSCEFINAWRHGILLEGAAKGVGNVMFERCRIADSGRDNSVRWNQLHGIYVTVPRVTIMDCVVANSAASGITVYGPRVDQDPSECTITGTKVFDYGRRQSPYVPGIGLHNGTGHRIGTDNEVVTRHRTSRTVMIESNTAGGRYEVAPTEAIFV